MKGDAIVISEPSGTVIYWSGKKLAAHAIELRRPSSDEPAAWQ